jgi:hypothetical protein
LFAERRGVHLVQVDLILRTTDREPHCLDCRGAVEIVFQRGGYLRRHLDLYDICQRPIVAGLGLNANSPAPAGGEASPFRQPFHTATLDDGAGDTTGA